MSAATVFLIVWGAVVRTTGSGLGCPDWPLCHGKIIPPFEKTVLIEYFHRLLATSVVLLTLGVAVAVWRSKELRREIGKWCGLAVGLLLVQIALGGVTVRTELHPHIVATHLGVALIFLATIFYMHLRLPPKCWGLSLGGDKTGVPRTWAWQLSHWTLKILFLQMVLGGLVAASNAGLACPDFPTCQGVWWPGLKGLAGIHFLHRLGALAVSVMVLALAIARWRLPIVKIIFFLALFQISLGIGNIFMGLPIGMRLAHNAVAIFLFLALIRSTYELRRQIS